VESAAFPEPSAAGTEGQGGVVEGNGRQQVARESALFAQASPQSGAPFPEPSSAVTEGQGGDEGGANQESDHSTDGVGSPSNSISTNSRSED
jgi:hypothetical protein